MEIVSAKYQIDFQTERDSLKRMGHNRYEPTQNTFGFLHVSVCMLWAPTAAQKCRHYVGKVGAQTSTHNRYGSKSVDQYYLFGSAIHFKLNFIQFQQKNSLNSFSFRLIRILVHLSIYDELRRSPASFSIFSFKFCQNAQFFLLTSLAHIMKFVRLKSFAMLYICYCLLDFGWHAYIPCHAIPS